MSALTAQMDAALAADRAIVTLFIEVMLPGAPLRLLAGGGTIAWNTTDASGNPVQKVFGNVDPVFGTLAAVDTIEDGDGDDAPVFSFTMYPPSNVAAAALSSPAFQGSAVNVWLAAISPATGLLIPDPDLLFTGELDVPTFSVDKSTREIDFSCVSEFELLLEDDEGARLSDSFHESIWPGETGFANVTGVEKDIYWGLATPPGGSVVTGTILPTNIIMKPGFNAPRVYD